MTYLPAITAVSLILIIVLAPLLLVAKFQNGVRAWTELFLRMTGVRTEGAVVDIAFADSSFSINTQPYGWYTVVMDITVPGSVSRRRVMKKYLVRCFSGRQG